MNDPGNIVNEASLPGLLRDAAPKLRNYITPRIPSKLRSIIATEDILQEVWIEAFKALPASQVVGADKVDHWLTTVARRRLTYSIRALQRLKRGGGQIIGAAQYSSSADVLTTIRSAERSPSSIVASTEAMDAIASALTELPKPCRQAIWLRFITEHPIDEVATMMRRTTGSVRSLIFRGMQQLKRRLGSAAKFLSDASPS